MILFRVNKGLVFPHAFLFSYACKAFPVDSGLCDLSSRDASLPPPPYVMGKNITSCLKSIW